MPSRSRWIADLDPPRRPRAEATHGYLPQAAMNLGQDPAGPAREVGRLVIDHQTGGWCLFRLDADGGFVGDTWHPDADDARRTAADEFGDIAFREEAA